MSEWDPNLEAWGKIPQWKLRLLGGLDEDDDHFSSDEEDDKQTLMILEVCRLARESIDALDCHRRRYIKREREVAQLRLWNDYFSDMPTYHHDMFRRRFRMRRPLFNRILEAIMEKNNYFVQKSDATNRLGLSPHQKMTAAIRMLAYGVAADAIDEYISIGETTVYDCVLQFCQTVIDIFGAEYMRAATRMDVDKLLDENAKRGFPGMVGSLDCMHWEWKNCPTSWAGAYSNYKRRPTIVLEAVASYDLWIWHAFFGMPGSNNDINVLDRSNIWDDLLLGKTPEANYTINGHNYDTTYYLADGIYPKLSTIVQTITNPENAKKRKFAQMQEAARKDVERAFGVLQSRWNIIRGPSRMWSKEQMAQVMKTCIILHNMIVEDERSEREPIDVENYYHTTNSILPIVPTREPNDTYAIYMRHYKELHDQRGYYQLRDDLIEHIWARHGDE